MSWSRLRDVVLVAALIGAVVISFWLLRSGDGVDPAPGDGPPATPRALAAGTERIRSELRPDGSIRVAHWLRTTAAVDRLHVEVADGLRARDLEVGVPGSSVVSAGSVEGGRTVRLGSSSNVVYVRYELEGAVARSGSTPGRSLAEVTFVAIEVDQQPRTRVLEVVGGTVRALACLSDARGDAPRPCGRPVGDHWQVRLSGDEADDEVSAQVDL